MKQVQVGSLNCTNCGQEMVKIYRHAERKGIVLVSGHNKSEFVLNDAGLQAIYDCQNCKLEVLFSILELAQKFSTSTAQTGNIRLSVGPRTAQ